MDHHAELEVTVQALAQRGKGLLAADESGPTIAKRFQSIGIESTEDLLRDLRNGVKAVG